MVLGGREFESTTLFLGDCGFQSTFFGGGLWV